MLNKKKLDKGFLITFEGIDGSGKSTQIKKLKTFIKKKNIKNFIFTREPGGSDLGKKIRNLLISSSDKNVISKEAQILLLLAARYEHYKKLILPKIKRKKVVVSDRFHDSTFAYQCGSNKVLQSLLIKFNNLLFNKFQPDLTILLDINPNLSIKRISKRTHNNSYDKKTLSFYKTVRSNYLYIAKNNNRVKVLNAEESEEEIFKKIKNLVF